jgi:hypothetical protein
VFENRVLRKISGPKGEEITGEWTKLNNEELKTLYSSYVTGMIKSKRMRWAGYVAFMGKGEVHTGPWWGNMGERDHLEDSGVDGKIIWRCIFRKWEGEGEWTGLIWLRIGAVGGLL